MFCVHCGKSNVENASFCAYCGKDMSQSTKPVSPKNTEWEYTFYNRNWEIDKGGHWNLTFGTTEYSVRLDNWGSDQNSIMPEIQEFLDKGWQYNVNPPGPNSYKFAEHTDYAGNIKYKWLSVTSFVVEFRRPARPMKENEKQLVGIWQETDDPNAGFWNTFGNIVFSQKLTVSKFKYVFRKDRIFERFNRDGEQLSGGVFFENDKGDIDLIHKYTPDDNTSVRVIGNKLIFNSERHQEEYERINQ